MESSIKLGRILGIPVGLHYSWFVILLVVTLSLEVSLGDSYPRWSGPERWSVALASALLLFASVVAHELSHSLVAIKGGIPVKGITLFVFGGVASIAREAARPGAEFLMAVVGPLTSLLLGALFLGLSGVVEPFSLHLAVVVQWLGMVNIALGLFNMLPGFPLDGGRVFRSLVWAVSHDYVRSTRIATGAGRILAVAFIVFGVTIFVGEIYLQGIWLAFIGWFLWQAGSATLRQLNLRVLLQRHLAREMMRSDCPEVSTEASVRALVEWENLRGSEMCLLVAEDGRVRGFLSAGALERGARESSESSRAAELMTPLEGLGTVGPDDDGYRVMEVMEEGKQQMVPVVVDEEPLGVILQESLARLLRRHSGR